MTVSDEGLKMIEEFEGLRLKPYLCSANVPTIGIGSTFYTDGTKVKMTDKPITEQQARELFRITLTKYERPINQNYKKQFTQNQFDALVSFCYNLGWGNLSKSTLWKKCNMNTTDPSIAHEFMKWCKASGKVVKGLEIRRSKEAVHYFKR